MSKPVPHDLPLSHVKVTKEGNTWNWEHTNCPLDPKVGSTSGTPTDSYEDAKKGAVTHVEVHGG